MALSGRYHAATFRRLNLANQAVINLATIENKTGAANTVVIKKIIVHSIRSSATAVTSIMPIRVWPVQSTVPSGGTALTKHKIDSSHPASQTETVILGSVSADDTTTAITYALPSGNPLFNGYHATSVTGVGQFTGTQDGGLCYLTQRNIYDIPITLNAAESILVTVQDTANSASLFYLVEVIWEEHAPDDTGITLIPATESDAAVGITWDTNITLGQALETDAAQGINFRTLITPGQALETDTAQPLSWDTNITLGQALESDAAQALSWISLITLGITTEGDIAVGITLDEGGGQEFITLTPATESDSAQAISWLTALTLSPSLETDSAQPLSWQSLITLTPTTEADAAQLLSWVSRIALGTTTETDQAQAITSLSQIALSPAFETDTATGITWVGRITLGRASELDAAVGITLEGEVVVAVARRTPIVIGRF